jgi:Cof subfamily protein (haloacid dehalogenase superfamily)
MQYKLVALDLDGTLLNSNHQIPSANVQAIQQLSGQGVDFVLVTGRPDAMAKTYAEQLGIPTTILGNNGATIRNVATKELYFSQFIDDASVQQVLVILMESGIYFRIYGLDSIATFNQDEFDESKNEFAQFSKNLAAVMDFTLLDKPSALHFAVIKLVGFSNDTSVLDTLRSKLETLSTIEVVRGSKNGIDVMARGINKGATLLAYAQQKGIGAGEIVAMGDSENDLGMLQLVGMPIAMGNAEVCVKEAAKFVSISNDEAGVAYALQQIFRTSS